MALSGNSKEREDVINLRLLVSANDNDPEHQVHIAHMSPLTHYGSFVHHEPHATYTTDDAYFILPHGQQNEAPNYLKAANDNYNSNNNNRTKKISSPTMWPITVKKNNKSRIRNFTLGLIVLLTIVYVVWWLHYRKNASINDGQRQGSRLIMVNVFNRHGDRSPGTMRKIDPNIARLDHYWPNGLGNLTTVGKMRQFRVGLELRQIYDEYLGYDASNVLTLTSPLIRCQESLKFTLMGLYDIDQEASQGLAQLKQVANCSAHQQQCLSPGSGSPNEWKKVKFDTNTVKSLTYEFLNGCSYRKKNPPAMDYDLMIDPLIRTMPGVERLKVVIKETFGVDFNFTALDLWGTVACELQLHRTQSTIADEGHLAGWVNELVPTNRPDIVVNLFQIYESVAAIGYLSRVEGKSRYVQAGPMITSIVESQTVALNENGYNQNHTLRPSSSIYSGKKMVIYSSHDSVIQIMLHSLGIIRIPESFEDRYDRGKGSNTAGLASGMKMSNYGFSLRIELWNLEREPAPDSLLNSVKVFTIVKASIYNDAEVKYRDINYEPVQFGSICRILFKEKHPSASEADLDSFYDRDFEFDHNLACPFNLFHHVMSEWLIDDAELKQLCE